MMVVVTVMVFVVMPATMPAMVSMVMPVVVVMFGGPDGRCRSAIGAAGAGRRACRHGIKDSRRRIARNAKNYQKQD